MTKQLSKIETKDWLAHYGGDATIDYIARRSGYTLRASNMDAVPRSIWLDHFTTESAARAAVQMMKPESEPQPLLYQGGLF